MEEYCQELSRQLSLALCLLPFPSQDVERHSQPEVEFASAPELLLPPVTVTRKGAAEQCLIEPSINSTRISFRFREGDTLDELLGSSFFCFMRQRADELLVCRRHPMPGWHVSFLVTDAHTSRHDVWDIIDFLVQFATDTPAFLRSLKLDVSSQNRAAAADYMRSFAKTAVRAG